MRTVLLISNVTTDDPGGRAADLSTREDLLRDHGWEQVIGHVPEPYVKTFLPSILRCYRRGRRVGADLVVSVSNPFHLQVVGFVVSRLLRVPWVVEFRDPMVTNPDRDPNAALTKVARAVEHLCVTRAERVLWTDGIQAGESYYRETYPTVDPDTFVELPFKGYERGTFERADAREYGDFTVTYAGSFYEDWIEPYAFLEGLNEHVEEVGDELTVQFYGDWKDAYTLAAQELGVKHVVTTYEFVPHEDIVPVLKGSNVALYIGGTDPKNSESVPSKLWDYIGGRTTILALVDPDFRVAEIIERNGLGIVVDPRDTDAIAEALDDLRSGAFTYDPNPEVFKRFARETKIEAMAKVFDNMTREVTPRNKGGHTR
jgi:glycosyltransferase involved in cell wall biosynthesis